MTPPAVTPKTAVRTGLDPHSPRQFTFEEYCAYEDGTDNRYELVQGYLQLMSPPAGLHIIICEFLVYVFNRLFAFTHSPLRAGKEVGVRVQKNTCRIVDVCVNGESHWQQISQPGEKGIFLLAQTPLLVVEVTNTNEKEDYKAKFQEYAAVGILEYWIVNSRKEQLRVCTPTYLGGPYQYQEFGTGEHIVSQVLPQLDLTVDEVLNPPAVRQLIELEQAQQTAERDALEAENTTIAAERDALEAEKTTIAAERDVFKAERDALEAENAAIQQELEQLKTLMQARGVDSSL